MITPYELLNKYHSNILIRYIRDKKAYRLDMDATVDNKLFKWAILIRPEEIRKLQVFIYSGIVAFVRTFKKKKLG
jgi:hypothetical protein